MSEMDDDKYEKLLPSGRLLIVGSLMGISVDELKQDAKALFKAHPDGLYADDTVKFLAKRHGLDPAIALVRVESFFEDESGVAAKQAVLASIMQKKH